MLNYPIIDLHTHLRNDIAGHTKLARDCGVDSVVYMANSEPPLDNVSRIKKSLKNKRNILALPVSAITRNLEGKKLVDIDLIKDYVVGFSDDGKYLANLNLLAEILKKGVLVLAHCCPEYQKAVRNPDLETEYIEKHLQVLEKVGGKLHIQHVSKKASIEVMRRAKKRGLELTCETCPHYFSFTTDDLKVKVNPPLGNTEDVLAVRRGLADGTIDVIASDFAPKPRVTGIAGFRSLISLSYGLVLAKILTERQLREKLYLNPLKIIRNNVGIKIIDQVFSLELNK